MKRPTPAALLIDLDGVIIHGDRALPGAGELLRRLAGRPHAFVTNNPIRTPAEICDRLESLALPRPDPDRVVTSALATARYLSQWRPGFHYYAVGAEGLDIALRDVGTADPVAADVVVVGEGPGLDYETLTIGVNLILKRGARLVATNPDTTVDDTLDGHHRVLPGGGALVAPFAAATGVTPTVIGKPEPLLFEIGADLLGVPAARCLMLGDRPDTDIEGARRLGMWTALVRTGRFPPGATLERGGLSPDYDMDGLPALIEVLDRRHPGILGGSSA